MVSNFNRKLQARLSPEIHWIDSYSYLQGTGYTLTDGSISAMGPTRICTVIISLLWDAHNVDVFYSRRQYV